MYKRFLWITFFLVFLILPIFLWDKLFLTVIEWGLESQAHALFQGEFSYERCEKQNGGWVFYHPKVKNAVTARKLEVHYCFPKTLEIFVQEPEFVFPTPLKLTDDPPFIQTKIAIEHGVVGNDKKMLFDAEVTASRKGIHLVLEAIFDRDSHDLKLDFLKSQKQSKLSFQAEKLNATSLATLSQGFGLDLMGWQVEEGVINGSLSYEASKHSQPTLSSDLEITHFIARHPTNQTELSLPYSSLIIESGTGHFSTGSEASILIGDKNMPAFTLSYLVGDLHFDRPEEIHLSLSGEAENQKVTFDGVAGYFENNLGMLDLTLQLESPELPESSLHVSAYELGKENNTAHFEIKDMGVHELKIFQQALKPFFFELNDFSFQKGIIDATGQVLFNGWKVSTLTLKKAFGKDIKAEVPVFDLSCRVKEMEGQFFIDLTHPKPIQTMDLELMLREGYLKVIGIQEKNWRLNDFNADILVNQGVIQRSKLQGEFAGLQAQIDLDWLTQETIATIELSGGTQDLDTLLIPEIFAGIQKCFSEDHLKVHAKMKRKHLGAKIEGVLEVYGKKKDHPDEILFGFDLEKCSSKLWSGDEGYQAPKWYWQSVGKKVSSEIFPNLLAPALLFQSNWMKSESGIAGFLLRNGWMYAENLPLQKYVEPFVFYEGEVKLKGVGDFRGFFDHKRFAVDYSTKDLQLDSKAYTLEVPQIAQGAHYFDFENKVHFGSMPIRSATYFDKNYGILFTDLNALFLPEGRKLHVPTLECFSGGVFMEGSLDIDYAEFELGRYYIDIFPTSILGSTSQVQDFFRHFLKNHWLLDLPLSGDMALKEGAKIAFDIAPNQFILKTELKAGVCNANYSLTENLSLTSLDFDFSYSHETKRVEIIQGSGFLLANNEESYRLSEFDGVLKEGKEGEYHLQVLDRDRKVLDFFARQTYDVNQGFVIDLDLEKSHVLNHSIKKFSLSLDPSYDVNEFLFETSFPYQAISSDLEHFLKLYISYGSDTLLEMVPNISTQLDLHLSYTQDKDFSFSLLGEKMIFQNKPFGTFQLLGRVKGSEWKIDRLSLDDFILSCDFNINDQGWNVPFFGIQSGQALLLGIEDVFFDVEGKFQGKVKRLDLNFEELESVPFSSHLIQEWKPHGVVKGQGAIQGYLGKKVHLLTTLDVSFKKWSLKEIPFEDIKKAKLTFSLDDGLVFSEFPVILNQEGESIATTDIKELKIDLKRGDVYLDGCRFQFETARLPTVVNTLSVLFPEAMTPLMKETMISIQSENFLSGKIHLERVSGFLAFHLTLADDTYSFFGKKISVEHFSFDKDPFEWHVRFLYELGDGKVWVRGESSDPYLEKGRLYVSEEEVSPKEALFVDWEFDPGIGFSIVRAKGSTLGYNFDLARNYQFALSQSKLHLSGEISVDPCRAAIIISKDLVQALKKWQIGSGWRFSGDWVFHLNREDLVDFKGELNASHLVLKGYLFQKVNAKVLWLGDHMAISEFTLNDPSMEANFEVCHLKKVDREWYLHLPKLSVLKMRPSLLKKPDVEAVKEKPLVIKELDFYDLKGKLSDLNTFTASGKLHFQNRAKKKINPIFHIPGEILSRIGLDLGVLNPVTGQITYKLQGGRIYLTKFKDMYSEGKLSKFYLSGSNYKSYVDFDGNLHLQIRMRQYNLVFKLAELLTVTIQGTIDKPVYSLQTQKEQKHA